MTSISTINDTAAQRILVHDEEARKAGFSPAVPYFAIGTRLVQAGMDAFRQSRLAYDRMPSAETALEGLITTVQAEKRQDFDVAAGDLHMLEDGRLWVKNGINDAVSMTPHAFLQLCGRLADKNEHANPGRYFASIEPERRARYLNEELKGSAADFKLRARQPNGAPELYAVTSQGYPTGDADKLAAALLSNLNDGPGGDAVKCSVIYKGTRSQIDLLYHADMLPQDVGVGEFYKAAQRLTSDDDGTEGARWRDMLYRALCINLTTAVSEQQLFYQRHQGTIDKFLRAVAEHADPANSKLGFFIKAFTNRSTVDVRELIDQNSELNLAAGLDNPQPIFRALFDGKNKLWAVPGAKPGAVAEMVLEAWLKESADWSIAGLSNAISRAAHEQTWESFDMEQALEDRAGALITTAIDRIPFDVWTEEQKK